MNLPVPTPVSVTLTITQDGKGNLQYAWSGSNYVGSTGDFNLTSIHGGVQLTITISTTLQVCFCTPASATLWLGLKGVNPPTGPYSGTEFTTPTFVNNSVAVLQWNDMNTDGLTYEYVLLLWQVNAAYPGGHVVKLDPRVVNRGSSK